jgi:hypothetical protein
MEPHAFEIVERVAQLLGAQPAIVLVGYLLVRELRQWRRVLAGIGGGLSGVSSAVNNLARQVESGHRPARGGGWPTRA